MARAAKKSPAGLKKTNTRGLRMARGGDGGDTVVSEGVPADTTPAFRHDTLVHESPGPIKKKGGTGG